MKKKLAILGLLLASVSGKGYGMFKSCGEEALYGDSPSATLTQKAPPPKRSYVRDHSGMCGGDPSGPWIQFFEKIFPSGICKSPTSQEKGELSVNIPSHINPEVDDSGADSDDDETYGRKVSIKEFKAPDSPLKKPVGSSSHSFLEDLTQEGAKNEENPLTLSRKTSLKDPSKEENKEGGYSTNVPSANSKLPSCGSSEENNPNGSPSILAKPKELPLELEENELPGGI